MASSITTKNGFLGLRKKIDSIISAVTDVYVDRGLRKNAELIRDEAVKRAPVDTGYLEDHIEVIKISNKNYLVVSNAIKNGVNYALFLHESPNWNLGPGSLAKQARQSEKVGNKWLTRAANENKSKLHKDFADSITLRTGDVDV
jgi:hypothetical protein